MLPSYDNARETRINIPSYDRPGVYAIINISTGQRYIGSSCRVKQRIKNHAKQLENGTHFNPKLQAAYNNGDCFRVEVLEEVSSFYGSQLLRREKFYIEKFNSVYTGYNRSEPNPPPIHSQKPIIRHTFHLNEKPKTTEVVIKFRTTRKRIQKKDLAEAMTELCSLIDCKPEDIMEYVDGGIPR